jgi:lipoprotein-anchoring transpeptidase ErfK/SrfK
VKRLAALAGLLLAGCGAGSGSRPAVPGTTAAATAAPASTPAVGPAPVRAQPGETLAARVVRRVALRAAPSSGARVLARVGPRTAFRSISVLAVVRRRGTWLGVVHPALGNGHVGWVRQSAVVPLREQWSIVVDLSQRRATLRRLGRAFRSFAVAVGTPAHPTPTGRFGVTDRLSTGGSGSVYGCCALALSASQPHVAQDWPGGDRIAIHGTDDPASVGTAASHGCLRATEPAMRLLIARVPLGAQVVIHA